MRCASVSAPRSGGALQLRSACRCLRSWRSSRSWAIPFGVALLLAAIPVLLVAYGTTAWIVGRRVVGNRSASPWAALLAGWGILRVLALIPVAGALVGLAATVVGLGALAVALWRARRTGAPIEARGAGSGPSRTSRLTWPTKQKTQPKLGFRQRARQDSNL